MSETNHAPPTPNDHGGGDSGAIADDQPSLIPTTPKPNSKHPITILIFVCGLMLLFFIISAAAPQLQSDRDGTTTSLTYWRERYRAPGVKLDFPVTDTSCWSFKDRMLMGGAFAVIGMILLTAAIVALALELFCTTADTSIGASLRALAWLCSMVCWCSVANAYEGVHCGSRWATEGGYYGPGFGMMVFNWVFMFISLGFYLLWACGLLPDLRQSMGNIWVTVR